MDSLANLDLSKVAKLAEKVDLNQLISMVSNMDPDTLNAMMRQVARSEQRHDPPPVNADFYDIYDLLTPEQMHYINVTREFFNKEVTPVIDEYWIKGEFPKQLIPKSAEYVKNMLGEDYKYQFMSTDPLVSGLVSMEHGRLDPSYATFYGVHWFLSMGTIEMFGSDEQKAKWLPPMQKFEKIGSWALTEPLNGSDAVMGLKTTAQKAGDKWILNGQKKWSGNATFADVNVIWAKNSETGQVNGYLVELGQAGYHVEKIEDKIAKRAVENVVITLTDVEVHESDRLPGAKSFADVGRQLAEARAGVAWEAVGVAMGAYEAALEYANNREQFGKSITSYQMIQHNLVRMLGNVTAMQGMMVRLAQLQARDGYISHERASLAKAWCTTMMRETVAIARGMLGGNGILLEHKVARLFADAEAIYSYEGSYEMNVLITGRAITGRSAFV